MSKRDILLLLDDMLQSAKKIKRYTKDLDFESFFLMTRQVMQLFEILRSLEKQQIELTRILEIEILRLNGRE